MAEGSTRSLQIDGKTVEISNEAKLLFPEAGISKFDLAEYYARIGEVAIAFYHDRALTMQRFPDGVEEEGFFQKAAADHFPDWIRRVTLPKEGGEITQIVADSPATLVYLADQACITPHQALSRVDRHDRPDRMIFDLDPSDDDFGKVQETARFLHHALKDLDLPTFVQTTGSRGLHIVVPLDRSADFETVREFTRSLCRWLASEHPKLLTIEQRKDQRGDRVFLDDLRNAYGQTSVAPYAVRALPKAPIATPLDWSEAGRGDMYPQKYRIDNLFRRLAQTDDPWRSIGDAATALPDKSCWPKTG